MMTNREWLIKEMQNMSDEEFAKILAVPDEVEQENGCENTMCQCPDCKTCVARWLKAEHKRKPKLSETEIVILENIDKESKFIVRDRDGELKLYTTKPHKLENSWFDSWGEKMYFETFNHLFQFIKWEDEEPYNIEELLKGE